MTELNKENFNDAISRESLPVAVMVKATWCSNCKALVPVFESVAKDLDGKANFYYLTVDDQEELARSLKILGVPTLLFYRHGILVDKKLGIKSSHSIKKLMSKISSYSAEEAQNSEYRSLFSRLFGRK